MKQLLKFSLGLGLLGYAYDEYNERYEKVLILVKLLQEIWEP